MLSPSFLCIAENVLGIESIHLSEIPRSLPQFPQALCYGNYGKLHEEYGKRFWTCSLPQFPQHYAMETMENCMRNTVNDSERAVYHSSHSTTIHKGCCNVCNAKMLLIKGSGVRISDGSPKKASIPQGWMPFLTLISRSNEQGSVGVEVCVRCDEETVSENENARWVWNLRWTNSKLLVQRSHSITKVILQKYTKYVYNPQKLCYNNIVTQTE